VRLNAERTVEVSTPLKAECTSGPCTSSEQQSAEFVGANEAGTRVFFTTSRALVTGDTDTGSDLYMAQIGCPPGEPECEPAQRVVTSLVQVSHDSNAGQAAEVQGVSVVSPDGGRVYFVARGVLSGVNREGDAPVRGADNLYVYDSEDGGARFVAGLCSGPIMSGEAVDRSCPGDLASGGEGGNGSPNDVGQWTGHRELQTTGNGSFLLFTTYARLVPGDSDNGRDVYRYDAQTETLDRVSVGEAGYDTNGNGNGNSFNAEIPLLQTEDLLQSDELSYRAISEDGSRVVFESAEPLSPHAINNLINAYEWHKEPGWSEGRVSLVSTGADEEPVGVNTGTPGEIMITPSGRDIFFKTVQGLSPQDTDGVTDVYDARLGAGFPAEAGKLKACEGDACQGPLMNPAPLLVPGSVAQVPGENVASPVIAAVTTPKKATPKCSGGRKLSHRKCVKSKKKVKKAKRAANNRRAGR
jgi:hypothetical protein